MKRMILMLLAAMFVLMTVISCKPAEDIPNNSENKSSFEDYPFSGIVQQEMKDVSKNMYGTFKFATMSTLYDNWYVSLKSDGTAVAAKIDELYGGNGVSVGTWNLDGNTLSLSVKGMADFSGKNLIWTDWEEDKLVKYVENSAYYGLLYKKYDEASLSIDTSSLIGLWIHTNDYGESDGFRFLSDVSAWRYTKNGKSYKLSWLPSSKGNEIRMTDEGGFSEYYNFVIVADDLYLDSTRYSRIGL